MFVKKNRFKRIATIYFRNSIILKLFSIIVAHNPLLQRQQNLYNEYIDSIWRCFMITRELGKRIQELRKEIGLSQEKFALKIEMDRTYYASVESGKRNISIINIKKIADGLGVSLSDLFKDL